MTNVPLDLVTVQQRLAQSNGRDYWRGLEELAETAEFQDFLHREFPRQASEWLPTLSRRNFLQLMGASLALAGLTACSNQPDEKIVPYVQMPEETVPGQPLFFATALQLGGYAMGLLAQSQLNRPIKVEGNPDHPASLGATDALAQASILNLYDPDRTKTVTHDGVASSWEEFLTELQTHLAPQQASGGAGLRILTETVTSPTLFNQLQALLTQFPNAVWHQYEPVNRDNVYAGAQLAFGEAVEPIYRLDQADVIVSLEADLFGAAPGRVRYARDFADGRRDPSGPDAPAGRNRNRLYVIESSPTITGAAADHRLALKAGQVEGFARALALALGLTVTPSEDAAIPVDWVSAIAQDLQAYPGASLVVAGDQQPAIVHALAHAINDVLGNGGQTVIYSDPVAADPSNQTQSLRELVDAMTAGQVELLLILGGNPVYTAPADLDFAAALENVPWRVHLGSHMDETAVHCQWQIPESHYLEAWSDGRAYDGTITIQQPLIQPLYASRSAHEVLDALLSAEVRSDHDLVQAYWASQRGEDGFAAFWQRALHDGIVADTALLAKRFNCNRM